ncbi:nucleotide-diphospho-sugar transferase [Radiomyces spectabilis]|uniref:nucleotide-diphospho-sugar transferase n=1 Tax=Radiomyces spectabilis TaxID=64574 RepID=UPI0022204C17|nr:nucleotide-diphospho-sugar transferase [Radiomyces spectabilis]KAI8388732.1 nucleotide-diphospho-sugar transferase [Radiomyces spectabilis]
MLSPKPRPPTDNEKYYRDAHSHERKRLPTLFDKPSVQLSCIVPAFDESQRLPTMLKETVVFLEQKQRDDPNFSYEIIIVDDGSRDNTVETALDFSKEWKQCDLRIISLEKNRGKGGAVTQGMLAARGKLCLMVDADGATRFSDYDKVEHALTLITDDGHGVAVGSRSHLVTTEAVVKRSFIRNLLMRGFHTLVYVLGIRGIEDTQCGFKLFTRKTAQIIFPNMHVERWIFDIECLMIAQSQHIPITEVQVNWHEIDGSKVNLMKDSILMARDLFLIRLNYVLGLWSVRIPKVIDE